MLQKLLVKEQFKKQQKLQVILPEIKNPMKLLHQAKQRIKKKKIKDKKYTYHQKKQQIIEDLRLL